MAQQESTRRRQGGPGSTGSGLAGREIPDKLYFRIGEVSKLCDVPAYVLRFWESEFPQLKPNKGGTGQRLYRRRDVEMALRVKTLLYDQGFTIAGARQAFKADPRTAGLRLAANTPAELPEGAATTPLTPAAATEMKPVDKERLHALRKELADLHALLAKSAQPRPAVQTIRAPRPRLAAPAPALPASSPIPTPFARPRLLKPAPPKPADAPPPGLFDGLFPAE
jgi:DNA-binding transcriptional MerR regulator